MNRSMAANPTRIDRDMGMDEEENHTLTYDFNSLRGIIFGIRTPDEDRIKKPSTLFKRKCEEYKRTRFQVLSGRILAREQAIFASIRYRCLWTR